MSYILNCFNFCLKALGSYFHAVLTALTGNPDIMYPWAFCLNGKCHLLTFLHPGRAKIPQFCLVMLIPWVRHYLTVYGMTSLLIADICPSRRILGRSFWSNCVRFTFADLLTNTILGPTLLIHSGLSVRAGGGGFLPAISVWCAGYKDRLKCLWSVVACECIAAYQCPFSRLLQIFRTTLQ